jgi:hypothetical protein
MKDFAKVRNIILILFLTFSINIFAEQNLNRADISHKLTEMAVKREVKIKFTIDSNDDKTLILFRESSLRPEELSGDWTMYLLSIGTTPEYLKESGFNKVRIYTTKSKDITDYILKPLL